MIKTAGEQFKRGKHIYFIASHPNRLEAALGFNRHMLIAVNEIKSSSDEARVLKFIESGVTLFIDSGVFNLTNKHVRAHGCTMDEALGLAPEQIDGFAKLFDRYVEVCRSLGEKSWGYIEIDQGGMENKIKTRAKLEALGLRPIPVYHPLNDGWDYFDYLAERYDRICFGNVVQADGDTRKKLITTAYIRRMKYPHLWIHLLGVTPSELTHGCPSSSSDSSTWLNAVRWSDSAREWACGKGVGGFDRNMAYDLTADSNSDHGSIKAVALQGMQAEMNGINWNNFLAHITKATA